MQTITASGRITIDRKKSDYLILLALAASFFVLGMFRAFDVGNGRAIATVSGSAAFSYWAYVLFMAAIGWGVFELVLRLYYFFVSLSIFTFVVPKKRALYVFRWVFAIRNLAVAGLSFLLFVSPVFVNYLAVLTFVLDFFAFVAAFAVICGNYLNELLAPFAWKAFLRPFILYETIIAIFQCGGVL